MTNRVTYAPQDFQKMCKQAERDHETKKLVELMDRVKRQIAARQSQLEDEDSAGAATRSGPMRLPSRSVPLER
jgi:hypothetical protein